MSYKEPLDDELLLVHPTKLQAMGHFHGLLGRWFVGPWSIVGWLMADRFCFGLRHW